MILVVGLHSENMSLDYSSMCELCTCIFLGKIPSIYKVQCHRTTHLDLHEARACVMFFTIGIANWHWPYVMGDKRGYCNLQVNKQPQLSNEVYALAWEIYA